MTFPTVRSGQPSVETGNVPTHNVLLPATIEPGDLLVVFMSFDGNPTVTWDDTTAGTWTQRWLLADGGNAVTGACYVKIADGTEDALTLLIGTSVNEQSVTRAVAYQDWSGSLTDVVAGTPATGASTTPNPPSVAKVANEDYALIAVEHNDFSRTVTVFPTNYGINNFNDVSGGGAGCGLGTAKRELNSAATSEDPGTFTINSSDQWIAGTLAIRPGAPGVAYPFSRKDRKVMPSVSFDPWTLSGWA